MNSYSTPIAIVIAGALIAGALFFSNAGPSDGDSNLSVGTAPIELRAVRADEHLRGNPEATVVMVEFSDTECPFCKQFDTTMHQVIAAYEPNEVAWVYRHFPLTQLHPKAPKEAEAMECAAEMGGNDTFWAYSDELYSTSKSNNPLDIGVYNTPTPTPTGPDGTPYYEEKTPRSVSDAGRLTDIAVGVGLDKVAFEECLASDKFASLVQTDSDEATNSGGNGTPYVVFISKEAVGKDTKDLLNSLIPSVGPDAFAISKDGFRISMSGALPFDMLKQIIDSLLK